MRDRAHVEAPDGWVVTKGMKSAPIVVEEVGKAEPVVANFEAFARAVRGVAPYPITGEDMVNNIALLEAIVRGATSGRTEACGARKEPSMKALIFEMPDQPVVRDVEMPRITENEVLVQLRSVGICHSDYELLGGRYIIPISYPVTPGHEWCGEIVEVGRNVRELFYRASA